MKAIVFVIFLAYSLGIDLYEPYISYRFALETHTISSMYTTIYTDAIDSLKNKVGINITEEIKIGFLTVKFSSTLKSFTKLGINSEINKFKYENGVLKLKQKSSYIDLMVHFDWVLKIMYFPLFYSNGSFVYSF